MSVVLTPLDRDLIALVHDHALPVLLGMARIGMIFFFLPYLSSGAISSKVARTAVSVAVLIGMWPVTATAQIPKDAVGMLFATGTEMLVGTAIGLLVSLPFHVFHALGAIIDNQRGASISAAVDPLSGIEATETANLLNMLGTVVFLASGGMLAILKIIQASYALVPMGARWVVRDAPVTQYFGLLLAESLRMAMPVLLVLFLVEVFLGVLSRFAEQMNPFAVSLGVKSFVAFLAFLTYGMWMLVDEVPALWRLHDGLELIGP
jgi:type III secretion system export apparatus protein